MESMGAKTATKPIPPPVRTVLHRNIRRLRLARGLSQLELGHAVRATKYAVSNWERGLSAPNSWRLPLVAARFGVTVGYLFGES